MQHGEAEGLNVTADFRVKARASCDKVADVWAELGVNLLEKHVAEIESDLLRCGAEFEHESENSFGQPSLLGDLAENALMNEIEELGDAAEDGDASLTQGERQFLRVERIKKDDLAAIAEGKKQIRHLREHVKERQHSEQSVTGPDLDELANAVQFGGQVAIGQHDALGIAGSSGGVDDGGNIFRLDGDGNKTGLGGEHHLFDGRQAVGMLGIVISNPTHIPIEQSKLNASSGEGFLGDGEAALIHEEQGGAAVIQKFSNLVGGECGVKGNGGVTAADDSEIGGDPAWTIEGEDGAACATGYACADSGAYQPLRHAVREMTELLVSETFDGVAISGGDHA